MSKASILVIDDEPPIQKLLGIVLTGEGFAVQQATTAKEGILMAANHPPDLILLDIGLPDMSGHDVLKELRSWYARAIIILSVQGSETDIITALDRGATDHITKPFRTGELLARIRAAIRRNTADVENSVIVCGDLEVDLVARLVRRNAEPVKLTATEYNLLALFARNEGRVLTHHFLLKEVWGVAYQEETQYLRVFVRALRKKIEEDPERPKHIITESGVGYRFS